MMWTVRLVDLSDDSRVRFAVEHLLGGGAIVYPPLFLSVAPEGGLECQVLSSFQPANVTAATAAADRARAQVALADLLRAAPILRGFLGKSRWSLIDDYGTGCVIVGRFAGDRFEPA